MGKILLKYLKVRKNIRHFGLLILERHFSVKIKVGVWKRMPAIKLKMTMWKPHFLVQEARHDADLNRPTPSSMLAPSPPLEGFPLRLNGLATRPQEVSTRTPS